MRSRNTWLLIRKAAKMGKIVLDRPIDFSGCTEISGISFELTPSAKEHFDAEMREAAIMRAAELDAERELERKVSFSRVLD
jgi:hypothetical protein